MFKTVLSLESSNNELNPPESWEKLKEIEKSASVYQTVNGQAIYTQR